MAKNIFDSTLCSCRNLASKLPKSPRSFEMTECKRNGTNLCACRYTSNQARHISYFRLKNDVGRKNMRQTGGFDLLILRHQRTSASLYSFFPVREGVAIWATLLLNYGTKIRLIIRR